MLIYNEKNFNHILLSHLDTNIYHFTNESKAVFKSLIKGLIISGLSEQKKPIKFILSK